MRWHILAHGSCEYLPTPLAGGIDVTPVVQSLGVALIVAGALLYVGRRIWATVAQAKRDRAASCGTNDCCK